MPDVKRIFFISANISAGLDCAMPNKERIQIYNELAQRGFAQAQQASTI